MDSDMHRPDAEGFIPGVFNYCDRRCERCRFVRQCRVGALDVDDVGEAEDAIADERPEDLKERLRKLMGMPSSAEHEQDGTDDDDGDDDHDDHDDDDAGDHIDFAPADLEPTAEERRRDEEIARQIHQHPLTNMGLTYMDLVDEWLEPREAALTARGVVLYRQHELSMALNLRTPENLLLGAALDEVLWFKLMVHVKCQRALRGKLEDGGRWEDLGLDPLQSDWNGTAKLCKEVVGRSAAAWETVLDLMPGEADALVPVQELLRRLTEAIDREFPDSEQFIRPGFDAPRQSCDT
jgi:hypothetical protein